MNLQQLLEIRRKLKKKKPKFIRQDAHKFKRIKKRWRAPKGIHSKLREKKKGHLKQPSIGFSSPRKVRYLSSQGLQRVLVYTLNDLQNIDSKKQIAVIARTLGLRKKLIILKKALDLKTNILNIRNIQDFIKTSEERLKQKKLEIKKKEQEKKKEEVTKKQPVKETPEETKEEKEKREKEEKRKILEKR